MIDSDKLGDWRHCMGCGRLEDLNHLYDCNRCRYVERCAQCMKVHLWGKYASRHLDGDTMRSSDGELVDAVWFIAADSQPAWTRASKP